MMKNSNSLLEAACKGKFDQIKKEVVTASPFLKAKALMAAVEYRHREIALELLAFGAKATFQHYASLETALLHAIYQEDIDMSLRLIKADARLDIQDKGGYAAIHLATRENQIEVVKALLEAGADVNIRMHNRGDCALAIAAKEGHLELCQLLLDNGTADTELTNCNNDTPLYIAIKNNHHECACLLLEKGAYLYKEAKSENARVQALIDAKRNPDEWELVSDLSRRLYNAEDYATIIEVLEQFKSIVQLHFYRHKIMGSIYRPLSILYNKNKYDEAEQVIQKLWSYLDILGYKKDFINFSEEDFVNFSISLAINRPELMPIVIEKLVPCWVRGKLAFNLARLFATQTPSDKEKVIYFTSISMATNTDSWEAFKNDSLFEKFRTDHEFLQCIEMENINWNLELGGPFDSDVNPEYLFK